MDFSFILFKQGSNLVHFLDIHNYPYGENCLFIRMGCVCWRFVCSQSNPFLYKEMIFFLMHHMIQFKWLWVCLDVRENFSWNPITKKTTFNAPFLSYALCVRLLAYLPYIDGNTATWFQRDVHQVWKKNVLVHVFMWCSCNLSWPNTISTHKNDFACMWICNKFLILGFWVWTERGFRVSRKKMFSPIFF
jgi:hypothetical protein